MNIHVPTSDPIGEVRDDFIPASDYFSKTFADLENERLWPRVWQMACREEDIPDVGDFYTYDIVDESIIVIRTAPDEIKAFHNSCPHRGRRLTSGCGHTAKFHCRFHGWQFDLGGKPVHVVDREDWGDKLKDEDISLVPVKVGTWAGWVYINMDPESETLQQALAPATAVLDPLEMQGLRYHWVKSTIVPCNWKTILVMFSEGYHLQQAHRQVLRFQDDISGSHVHGRHGMFEYWQADLPGFRSRRLGGRDREDIRPGLKDFVEEYVKTLWCAFPMVMEGAVKRMMDELPAETPPEVVVMKVMEFTMEEAAAKGVKLPNITAEQAYQVGADWHLFPNHVVLPSPLACLAYRARPNGNDPESAIFDVYSLLRYPPNEEPKVTQEWSNDLTDETFWPKILIQDFDNIGDYHRGMKSRGFRGARPSPKQESAVSNFHRALREFMQV